MLNFYGPINHLGYGVHTYNLMKAYYKLNKHITLTLPFGQLSYQDELISEWLDNRKNMSKKDTGIMIFEAPFLNQFSGKTRIGFPVFETDIIPEFSKITMRNCDYLLTPSHWSKDVIKKEIKKDAVVIPEGYDPQIYYSTQNTEYKLHRKKTRGHITFTHVGKLEARKSTLSILNCFDKVFSRSDIAVTLKARVNNVFDSNWKLKISKYLLDKGFISQGNKYYNKGKLNIEIIDEPLNTFKEMADFYRSGDFGIYLSKAEGWNLPLMESIACGVPTLTTNVTGMTEYLKEYPKELLLNNYKKEVANDGKFFKGNQGEWYCPDLEEVCDSLQDMVLKYEYYIAKSEECARSIKEFTWENAAIKLNKFIKTINAR